MGQYDNKHFLVNNWEESRKLQQILLDEGYKSVTMEPYEYSKTYPYHIGVGTYCFSWDGGVYYQAWERNGSVLTPLPWITEKYYKKYFKVECKEDLSRLQQFLFDSGYTTNGNSTVYCNWGGGNYPIYIGTDYVANGKFGWAELESFYSDQEEYEFMELPWKSEQESLSDKLTAITKEAIQNAALQWTDKHYNFNVDVSDKDTLKVDPYFVSKTWKIGSKDESGALFHILKTISRFGSKNTREREIKAIYKQIVRLAELEGVELNEEK